MGRTMRDVTEPFVADPVVVAARRVDARPQRERRRDLRRVLPTVLSVSILLAPAAVACAVAVGASMVAPPPPDSGMVWWWLAVLAASAVAASAAQQAARRALPSATLLRLARVIPADVPSRLGLAMRAGTVRDLERGVIDLRDGAAQDVTEATALVVGYAAALQRHDRFTRGHCERVRAYTDLLSAEMGIPKEGRALLRWAALLHDIGKTEVSTELLNKPDGLDDVEWLAMREHAAAGGRLGEPLRAWLGDWVDAIGQHHERFEGTGYPLGLAGTDIALGARIVAVADSYETMTARRPYKTPMTHAAARRELLEQAGRHFDPVVVRAMLRLSVRKVRWAAGIYAVVGDALAATLIRQLGPRADWPRGAMPALRIAAFTTALATATIVGSPAPATSPPRDAPGVAEVQPLAPSPSLVEPGAGAVADPPPAQPAPVAGTTSPTHAPATAVTADPPPVEASAEASEEQPSDPASPAEVFQTFEQRRRAEPASAATPGGPAGRAVPATPATPATPAVPAPYAHE